MSFRTLDRHIKAYHTKQLQKKIKERNEKIMLESEELLDVKLTGLKCPYCSKYLTSKHSLNDHIKVKHEYINVSDRFLCDVSKINPVNLPKCSLNISINF